MLTRKDLRRWNLYNLQYETTDYYSEGAPTFHFNPGFKADFSTSSLNADDTTVKVQPFRFKCVCHVLLIALLSSLLKPLCTPAPQTTCLSLTPK